MGIVDLKLDDIGKVFTGVGTLAKDIRSAITGEISPEKKAEIEGKLLEIQSKVQMGQIGINNEEAKHASIFVAGWRPFIGWVCGGALVYHYFLDRLIHWYAAIYAPEITPPSFDMGDLLVILGGLLGMGALRTVEKAKGVNRKH